MSGNDDNLPGMIGRDPAMRDVFQQTRLAARGDLPVLVVGETGTGKELVARALHNLSGASKGPFIDVNCAALPESLAEGMLFGSERGAFTGAIQPIKGFLDLADGGTLFLDEACSLSSPVQAKLLRAIELREFWSVGGRERRRSRFRLVTAAASPVAMLLASGAWQPAFAHRVAGFTITIPPLRARPGDLPELARTFLEARQDGHPPKRLAPDAIELLVRYDWPGNVRELKALMERLRLATDGPVIQTATLMEVVPGLGSARGQDATQLFRALACNGWNTRKAARALGISRATLYRRIKERGIELLDRRSAPVS